MRRSIQPPIVADALRIRAARHADVAAITAIYNEALRERSATFETREREPAEVERWFDDRLPFLVVTAGDRVLGWARVSPYSDRCVYQGVGEHGVYVAGSARGLGLGRRLLDELCTAAAAAGMHKLTSRVFSDNAGSRAAHLAAGFEEVGIQRRHGQLEGEWKDCVLVERLLGDAAR